MKKILVCIPFILGLYMNIFHLLSNMVKLITLSLILLFVTARTTAQIPFKEDFGGANPTDPAWLLPSGGALTLGAWKSQHQGLVLSLPYADLADGVTSEEYDGLNALNASSKACYAITKIKYNDKDDFENDSNKETNINCGAGDHADRIFDHTTGDENGYFVIICPQNLPLSPNEVIYEKTLNVDSDIETLYFSAWAMNIRQYTGTKTRLTFKITNGTDTKSMNYDVPSGGSWEEYVFLYTVPAGTSSVTVSIIFNQPTAFSSDDTHLSGWEHSIALDDITVTDFKPTVTITEPASGLNFSQWTWLNFKADYKVLWAPSIYKWQFRAIETVDWSDIPTDNPSAPAEQHSSGTLTTPHGTIKYDRSFNGDGYYRVLVTDAGDTDYSEAVASQSIRLRMESAKSEDINYTQTEVEFIGDEVTFNASTKAEYTDPVFKWYSSNKTLLGTGPEYTTTLTATTPTSGRSIFKYFVTLQHDDLFESPQKEITVTANNNKMTEDFGGCDTNQPFIYSSDNMYEVPGYSYLNVNGETTTPNMESRKYLITKQVYQHDFGSGTTDWDTALTDHTPGCGTGYFILFHTNKVSETGISEFYKTTLDVCGGSKMSFNAWFANPGNIHSTVNFKFLVSFDNGAPKEYTTGIIRGGEPTPTWHQYGFDFFVPDNADKATFTIVQEGGDDIWNWGNAFAMDDIEIKTLNSVQILAPERSEIEVLTGQSITLKGSYACGGLTGTLSYQWQKSVNGTDWTNEGAATSVSNGNFITNDYATVPVNAGIYYRLTVSGGGSSSTLSSESIKISPITITSKTYFVCPDNMTDDEAGQSTGRLKSGENGIYLPGMTSRGEPGYLPSLIRMEVEELYGLTYKWYENEFGDTALDDLDEYDPNQESPVEVKDPVILSDGKTHTLSVQNERSTEGKFTDRTYWVEVCDMDGNALDGMVRIPIHLVKGYLCGSLDAEISPANARRLSRADFGGTEDGAPDMSTTPLTGIDYKQSITLNMVDEGQYQVSKKSADLNGGWIPIEDHIYENIANEKHGYLVAVNATETPGLFYTHQLDNLGTCREIELAFIGWFASPLGWKGNEKANLKFVLTDPAHNSILAEFTTGNMIDDENKWRQFGFRFTVPEGVNSLVLEIINNNFGTAGGNDVLMDDIEIYLIIPAVRLVPAEHSLVCENNRTVLLKGEYTDDGTLGKLLDYRWEYSVNGTDNWTVLTGSNAAGSVTNGIVSITQSEYIIDNFDTPNNGCYRLVVGQSGAFTDPINYDCVAISEPRRLTLADEDEAPILRPSLEGLTAYCYDDADSDGNIWIINTEGNTAENLKYSKYFWSLDGNIIEASDTDYDGTVITGTKVKLTDLAPGYHTISLTASNIADCSETSIHEFLIYPRTTTWTAGGDLNNWNDSDNWSDGVPGKCTDVIIPNESMNFENGTTLLPHYPFLLKPTTETLNENDYITNQENLNKQRDGLNDAVLFSLRPACDSITFKMGGAAARTDYLDYNFAIVDLDIEPKRWYTVSAPLRAMYSGDYFVEGHTKRRNPIVYMMKYNTSNPQTNANPMKQTGDFSNPFNTLTEELYPGLGYAIWVDNEEKPTAVLQPFRFPKDSVKYAMWEYSGEYVNTVAIPNLIGGKRANLGRFSYEEFITMNGTGTLPDGYPTGFDVTVKGDKTTYTTTMVGNPFMSHLDFEKFALTNGITGGYYIWDGSSYSTFNPMIFQEDPNEIPPMQAFVVNKSGIIERLTFTMDMAIKAPNPNSKGATVRSTILSQQASVLRMDVLYDDVVHSNIRLKYDQSEKNSYNARKDMWTLFAENIKTPVILYALLDGKAASIRTLGDLSEPIELGIHTVQQGSMTLRLSGVETLNDFYDLYLEDRLLGVVQNMRKNPEYTFENQTGDVRGRFVLRTTQDPTDNELISTSSWISIYSINKTIKIESPTNDPIQTVKVYSVLGELLYETNAIRTHTYSVDIASESQVVIVAVTTKLTRKNDKVIIK